MQKGKYIEEDMVPVLTTPWFNGLCNAACSVQIFNDLPEVGFNIKPPG